MLRNILGVIAGFIGGGILVFVVEAVGHLLYPVPTGLDMSKPELIAEYIKNAPAGALLSVIAAQSAGSFGGGLITGLIARSVVLSALVYGVLALIMAGLNSLLIPHPLWFTACALLLPIPLALVGGKLAEQFRSERT